MNDDAEQMFKLGKKYNLASSQTFEPAIARQYFELAARAGHLEANRSWALMLHQATGGPKDLKKAVALLAHGYFGLRDFEALECLVEVLREEIDDGQTTIDDVNVVLLADKIESLQKISEQVTHELHQLILPKVSDR